MGGARVDEEGQEIGTKNEACPEESTPHLRLQDKYSLPVPVRPTIQAPPERSIEFPQDFHHFSRLKAGIV
jgi:hypothetical protein